MGARLKRAKLFLCVEMLVDKHHCPVENAKLEPSR